MAEIYVHIGEDRLGPFGSMIEADNFIGALKALDTLFDAGVMHGARIEIERIDKCCDFCSTPDPVWLYKITTEGRIGESAPGIVHMDMDGLWAACNPCHDLIEARKNSKLAERSADSFYEINPEIPKHIRPQIVAGIRDVHNYFFTRWDGAAGIPVPDELK